MRKYVLPGLISGECMLLLFDLDMNIGYEKNSGCLLGEGSDWIDWDRIG
jgi:hypothetical protein